MYVILMFSIVLFVSLGYLESFVVFVIVFDVMFGVVFLGMIVWCFYWGVNGDLGFGKECMVCVVIVVCFILFVLMMFVRVIEFFVSDLELRRIFVFFVILVVGFLCYFVFFWLKYCIVDKL